MQGATRMHLCRWSYVCSLRTKSDLLCLTAKPSGASSDLKSLRNKSAACDVLQDKSFLFMRNLAAGRSAAEGIKTWSQGRAVPALVARLQNAQPPQHVLVHVLYCLSNFASTGQRVCPSVPRPTFCILLLRTCCDYQSNMAATGQLILRPAHLRFNNFQTFWYLVKEELFRIQRAKTATSTACRKRQARGPGVTVFCYLQAVRRTGMP